MLDLLRSRRSIRKFTDEPVSEADRKALEEAVLRSPSSRGFDPWQFVFVDDPALLDRLARCKAHGGAFVKKAPLAVVVCADEAVSDTWIEDASIATILCQLAAHKRGLGSCWVQIRLRTDAEGGSAEANVRDTLGLPDGLRVLSLVAVGHPAEEKVGHPAETLKGDRLHRNRVGT